MPRGEDVLIVGAGIIGLACADRLSKAGLNVTLIDKGKVGGACSFQNCGHILPSHVLPLNSRGAIGVALKSLFQIEGSLKIKPNFSGSSWRWMMSFLRHCNGSHRHHAAKALKPLLDYSYDAYQTFLEGREGDVQWRDNGLLYLFGQSKSYDAFVATNRWLTETIDLKAKAVSGAEIKALEPSITSDLAGGFFYEKDASLSSEQLVNMWTSVLKTKGMEVIEHCPLQSIEIETGKIAAITCGERQFRPAHTVFAMGSLSGQLAQFFNSEFPVMPGKGYSITIPQPTTPLTRAVVMPEPGIATTPFDEQIRMGAMMEFSGFDDSVPPHRIESIQRGADPFFESGLPKTRLSEWYGWRPMTPDSLPLIGPIRYLDNAFLATGHQMIGMMSAPATGQIITDYIMGQAPSIPAEAFTPSRFQ